MVENVQERAGRQGSAGNSEQGAVSEMAARAREVVSDYSGAAKEYVQKGYRYAADKATVAKESTEGYIKENPWYAVGIALGAGLLIGMLLKSRSRD
jgi:ElaB/YqjD/DUF883 family membrane-anchored ribosome-binding protein